MKVKIKPKSKTLKLTLCKKINLKINRKKTLQKVLIYKLRKLKLWRKILNPINNKNKICTNQVKFIPKVKVILKYLKKKEKSQMI
jgi:hypothetical protein